MLCAVMCSVARMSACGSSKPKYKDYAGNYIGQSNATLILNDDGTCKYRQMGD